MTDAKKAPAKKAPATKAAPTKASQPAGVLHEDKDGTASPKEQAKLATLTKVQPPNGAVSEVLTGTAEHPESTRIVPPGEVPASAGETRPAEYRTETQVASTDSKAEPVRALHGNADY